MYMPSELRKERIKAEEEAAQMKRTEREERKERERQRRYI
jgi:hypothetical protein